MNFRKIFCLLVLAFAGVLPFKVFAIEPVYDKVEWEDTEHIFLRATATSDGGYAVIVVPKDFLSSSSYTGDRKYIDINKYSSNGENLWSNRFFLPEQPEDCSNYHWQYNPQTGRDEQVCDKVDSTPLMGFTELDNGRLIVVSNYFRLLIASDGTLISIDDMGSQYYDYKAFRCENEGEGTACAAIGGDKTTIFNIFNGNNVRNERVKGRIFTLADDGSISNTFDIPCLPIVVADNATSIGVPVSIFKNEDDNYVVETIESVIPWVYVFDKNLRQISKKPVLIRNSSIKILEQIGDIYWINGQFNNGNYFGAYIKYNANLANSKVSYVTFNSAMNDVVNERVFADAFIDILAIQQSGRPNEEVMNALLEGAMAGVVGIFDGFRDGKYISLFDTETNLPYDLNDISQVDFNADFLRLDSSLNEFDRYNLISVPKGGMSEQIFNESLIRLMFSSIVRLEDGADVVVLNVNQNGVPATRHIKFGKQFTVSAVPQNVSDVTFTSSVYEPGDVVTVQLRQRDGYYIDKVIVRDGTGKIIDFNQKNHTFIMPDSDVTVEVQYKKINQVGTGALLTTILSLLALGGAGYSVFRFFKKQQVMNV
ncbi:MAG: hypothetical protein IJI22_01555 [Bacilli bacterium]|nr:hypothetical protein [Bacilli bacterium]